MFVFVRWGSQCMVADTNLNPRTRPRTRRSSAQTRPMNMLRTDDKHEWKFDLDFVISHLPTCFIDATPGDLSSGGFQGEPFRNVGREIKILNPWHIPHIRLKKLSGIQKFNFSHNPRKMVALLDNGSQTPPPMCWFQTVLAPHTSNDIISMVSRLVLCRVCGRWGTCDSQTCDRMWMFQKYFFETKTYNKHIWYKTKSK